MKKILVHSLLIMICLSCSKDEKKQEKVIVKPAEDILNNFEGGALDFLEHNKTKIKETVNPQFEEDKSIAIKAVPIYRFLHKKHKEHYYTQKSNPKGDWKSQGIEFYAYPNQVYGTIPIYQFLHKKHKDHFYTRNPKPKGNWKHQGIAFYAYDSQVNGSVPIYRFYSKKHRDHFYTMNPKPKGNWKHQGIEFYALPSKNQKLSKYYGIYHGSDKIPSPTYGWIDRNWEFEFKDDDVRYVESYRVVTNTSKQAFQQSYLKEPTITVCQGSWVEYDGIKEYDLDYIELNLEEINPPPDGIPIKIKFLVSFGSGKSTPNLLGIKKDFYFANFKYTDTTIPGFQLFKE